MDQMCFSNTTSCAGLFVFIVTFFDSCPTIFKEYELANGKDLFKYLVSLCVLFYFSKQTLIYPMKVLYSVPCLRLGFYLLLDSSKEY